MPERPDHIPEPPSFALRVGQQGGLYGDHPQPSGPDSAASPLNRRAAEWGLASLLIACLVLASHPVFAVFDLLYWVLGPRILETANSTAVGLVRVGACCAYVFV